MQRWLSCPTLKWGGGVGRRWPGDILFIKYCWKAPFWSLIFLQKHMLNIGCNTPRWDLLVYKIFLENPPSGASYFFNNNNVLDGGQKIMQENPTWSLTFFQ